jgi:hypothetical protein
MQGRSRPGQLTGGEIGNLLFIDLSANPLTQMSDCAGL